MDTSRRHFLRASFAAGGALGLGLVSESVHAAEPLQEGEANRPKGLPQTRSRNILILGGTNFTGPHHVRYALERGHSVTIFTRGRRKPGLFQDAFQHVEHLIGDREDNLAHGEPSLPIRMHR